MNAARDQIQSSPYWEALGAEFTELSEERVKLHLPFREANANPGQALHGGVAASLAAIGGEAVARACMKAEAGPFYTASLQISYLSAAIGEAVTAEARLLRRGKELCFTTVDIRTDVGKPIAHCAAVIRAGHGETTAERAPAAVTFDGAEVGPMAPLIEALPFVAARGLHIDHMADSHARISMPERPANRATGGGVHEGAVLALLDTTGAMAAWAAVPAGMHKASTPALQVQLHRPPPAGGVVAHARLIQRDRETFWSAVDCVSQSDGQVFAQGTVMYRIVVA